VFYGLGLSKTVISYDIFVINLYFRSKLFKKVTCASIYNMYSGFGKYLGLGKSVFFLGLISLNPSSSPSRTRVEFGIAEPYRR